MKDVLCLLAILFAYGLAGHLDYREAVAMEEALRQDALPSCLKPQTGPATSRVAGAEPKTPPASVPLEHEGIER